MQFCYNYTNENDFILDRIHKIETTDVIEDEFGETTRSPILQGVKEGYNIVVTPHIGGMTWEGQYRAWSYAIRKFSYIKNYLDGKTKELIIERELN